MNARCTAASLLALALAIPVGAAAQSSPPAGARPRYGVGVAIASSGLLGATEIHVPIQVAPSVRVEPSFGLLTADSGTVSTRELVLGIGVLTQRRVGHATDVHYGGRLKLGFARFHSPIPGASESGVDIVLAASLGGELWLGDHFTLGLETQLGFYALSAASGDTSGLFTEGVAMARVYF